MVAAELTRPKLSCVSKSLEYNTRGQLNGARTVTRALNHPEVWRTEIVVVSSEAANIEGVLTFRTDL